MSFKEEGIWEDKNFGEKEFFMDIVGQKTQELLVKSKIPNTIFQQLILKAQDFANTNTFESHNETVLKAQHFIESEIDPMMEIYEILRATEVQLLSIAGYLEEEKNIIMKGSEDLGEKLFFSNLKKKTEELAEEYRRALGKFE